MLPLAIGLGTIAAVAARDDDRLRCWSLQEATVADVGLGELAPGSVEGWAAYPLGVAWALREEGVEIRGADVVVDSSVPLGSGLSSSAALECAVGLALSELAGGGLDPVMIARAGRRGETEVVGVPSGAMDQMVSMLGRADHALFLDTRSLAVDQIPLDVDAAELSLLVIDTRVPRRLAEGAYAERRAACETAARVLGVPALRDATAEEVDAAVARLGGVNHRRARHVVSENARVLEAVEALRCGELDRLPPLLNASHRSLRDDYEVSAPSLETAVEAALAAGAHGARMTGAGFGGCAIALAPVDGVAALRSNVTDAFAAAGFSEPEVFSVSAADGARRLA